ncbi:MAG: SDR family oxidoreductase [Thermoplasmata archaeon]
MQILITGAAGLLGYATYLKLSNTYNVIPACHSSKIPDRSCVEIDVARKENFERINRVDVVVHTAALTNVDRCEKEPELAYQINVVGTKNAVDFARKWNAYIVYISTDYVFDGEKGNYREEEPVNPISVYGQTKLEGEKFVLDYGNGCVLRCCGNFGWKKTWQKHNFVSWVYESLRNEKEITIASDLIYSPVLVDFCAEVIEKLIEGNATGIFHCGSRNAISRLEFVYEICDAFRLDKALVKDVHSSKLNFTAKRPVNSSLNTEKLGKILRVPTTREMLVRMRETNAGT